MTFDHIESLAVAMSCAACGKYADAGMHQGSDGKWRHPHCCPVAACVAKRVRAEPLTAGTARPAGVQEGLFGALSTTGAENGTFEGGHGNNSNVINENGMSTYGAEVDYPAETLPEGGGAS